MSNTATIRSTSDPSIKLAYPRDTLTIDVDGYPAWSLQGTTNFLLGDFLLNSTGGASSYIGGGGGSLVDMTSSNSSSAGQTVYTADNGVVLTSSAGSYNNANNYYMEYMFDGDNSTTGAGAGTTYWLTSSSGNQTLTFDFTGSSISYIEKFRIYPKARTDSFSDIGAIETSSDGSNWTQVYGDQNLSSSISFGTYYDYSLATTDQYIRITLQQTGSYGVCLHEIEIYSATNVPAAGLFTSEEPFTITSRTPPVSYTAPTFNVNERLQISAKRSSIIPLLEEFRESIRANSDIVPFSLTELQKLEGTIKEYNISRGIASNVAGSGGGGGGPTETESWF